MNMTNVLHRKSSTAAPQRPLPSTPSSVPPSLHPPERDDGPRPPWPTGAKVIVAMLIAATVLATIGSAIGLSSGNDAAAERELQGQVATLTTERDDALGEVGALDADLATLRDQLEAAQAGSDELADRVVALEAEISSLTEARDAAVATVDDLDVQIVALTDQRDAALGTSDELEAQIAALTSQRDVAVKDADRLEGALATERQRLTTATAERDAFAKLFPITFDTTLGSVGTVGNYGVKATQIYCSGLTSCGTAPVLSDLKISKTSEGFLRANIKGFVDGGLFKADGALQLVAESKTAVPACNGTARTALVTMTVFPGGYKIGADGARQIVGLNSVITVDAPATGSCPAALAFYSADLAARA